MGFWSTLFAGIAIDLGAVVTCAGIIWGIAASGPVGIIVGAVIAVDGIIDMGAGIAIVGTN